MRLSLILLLFLSSLFVFAQKKGYYPSLKNRILIESEDKKISNDFKYFDDWVTNFIDPLFCTNFKASTSPNGDASLYSLGVIFRKNNHFNIGNSGFELLINKDKENFSYPVTIQMEQKYRILAYLRGFDPNKYNPKDFKNKFGLGLIIYNISQEQAMANFLNRYFPDNDFKAEVSNLQQMIIDLKREKNITIEIDEKKDRNILTNIAKQIYSQTNQYSSDILYDIYIRDKDKKIEHKKFDDFFKGYGGDSEDIDNVLSYEALIYIKEKNLSVIFPTKTIQLFSSDGQLDKLKERLELKPTYIGIKTVNNINEQHIEVEMIFDDNNVEKEFQAVNEIKLNKQIFTIKGQKPNQFKTKDIYKIIFLISEKEIEVKMNIKNFKTDYIFTIMKQKFSMN